MSGRRRKLSENEVAFRAFNEGIREVEQRVGGPPDADFVCECSDPACDARIRLPLAEYEQVRAVPIRFVVKLGHEVSALERVIRRTDDYAIIEKREGEAAETARR
jgi:hypothetical protein